MMKYNGSWIVLPGNQPHPKRNLLPAPKPRHDLGRRRESLQFGNLQPTLTDLFPGLFKVQIDSTFNLSSETLVKGVKGGFFTGLVQHRHGTRQASFHAFTCYKEALEF